MVASVAATASAQTSSRIEGIVLGDGVGVTGANIRISAASNRTLYSARTDNSGHFTVAVDTALNAFTLEVTAIGYLPTALEVRRDARGRLPEVSIALKKSVVNLPTVEVRAQRRRVVRSDVANEGGIAGNAARLNGANTLTGDMTGDPAALAATLANITVTPGASGDLSISVFGIGSDQNATVLNDMNFGGTLPRDAYALSVVSSTYDAGRGGFAGAQLSLRLRQGDNLPQRSIRSSLDVSPVHSSMEVFPQDVIASRQNVTNATAAGPLVSNRSFFAATFQLTRRTSAAPSLFSLGDASLGRLGTSSAAIGLLKTVLDSLAIPSGKVGSINGSRTTDARLAVRLDLEPGLERRRPGLTQLLPATNDDYSLQFGGSAKLRTSSAGSISSLPSGSAKSADLDGWIQVTAAKYLASNFLNEFTLSTAFRGSTSAPVNALPTATVSLFSPSSDAATPAPPIVQAGGADQAENEAATQSIALRNRLSWNSWNRHHSPSITMELSREAYNRRQESGSGSFAYQSIGSLATNSPDQFFRTLDGRSTRATAWSGALGIGDVFAHVNPSDGPLGAPAATPTVQYGLRFETAALMQRPRYNSAIDSAFGRRNDVRIASLAALPMVGFSWPVLPVYRLANGADYGRRGTLSGGIRKYRGTVGAPFEIPYLEQTGLDGGPREVTCVGSAVPIPNWSGYARGTSAIPDSCRGDVGDVSTLAQDAATVRLLSSSFTPVESWRPELTASLRVSDQLVIVGNASFAFNRHIASAMDLNFDGDEKFRLANEGNRPVYVWPASIVVRTGLATSVDSRRFEEFGRVYETRSDFRGETHGFGGSLRLSPVVINTTSARTTAALSYSYSSARQQASGFGATTSGDPRDVFWVNGTTPAHTFTFGVSHTQPRWAQFQAQARLQSGLPFTPLVDGDVNGDGLHNDRAFVFNPALAADTLLAVGMRRLIDTSPARQCLARQLSQLSAANSCASSWSMPQLDVAVTPSSERLPLGNRGSLRIVFSNVATAFDQLLHGSKTHGWGQYSFVDPNLLVIRGFDPAAQRYQYSVNSSFGTAIGPRSLLRRPFLVTLDFRLDVGRDRETLLLQSLLRSDDAPLGRAEIR